MAQRIVYCLNLDYRSDLFLQKKNPAPGPADPLGFTPNDWFFTGPPECGIPLILRMYTPLTSCTLTGLVAARLPVPVPCPRALVRCSLHHHLDPILSACTHRSWPTCHTSHPSARLLASTARCWPCSPPPLASPLCLAPGAPFLPLCSPIDTALSSPVPVSPSCSSPPSVRLCPPRLPVPLCSPSLQS
mgnify:CR=1 FL=1